MSPFRIFLEKKDKIATQNEAKRGKNIVLFSDKSQQC